MSRLTNHNLANMKNKDDWNKCFKEYCERNEHLTLGVMYKRLSDLEDIEEKYNVNEDDIEVALIVKKIIKNGFVYYEDGSGEGKYWYGFGLEFDFEKNEIVLSEEIDDDYGIEWEEKARLPILDYKKTWWLKQDKSE